MLPQKQFIKDTGKDKDKNKKHKNTQEATDTQTAEEEAGHGKDDLELRMVCNMTLTLGEFLYIKVLSTC